MGALNIPAGPPKVGIPMEEALVVHVPDGPTLEARLGPVASPIGGFVICHPHPLYGGDMDNPVVIRAAEVASAAGYATLRFNFRGAGGSEGAHDKGRGEQEDVTRGNDHARRPSARREPDRGHRLLVRRRDGGAGHPAGCSGRAAGADRSAARDVRLRLPAGGRPGGVRDACSWWPAPRIPTVRSRRSIGWPRSPRPGSGSSRVRTTSSSASSIPLGEAIGDWLAGLPPVAVIRAARAAAGAAWRCPRRG